MKAVDTGLHRSHDPLGLAVTTDGFRRIGQAIARLGLATVIVQEGGYLPDILSAQISRLWQGSKRRADIEYDRVQGRHEPVLADVTRAKRLRSDHGMSFSLSARA